MTIVSLTNCPPRLKGDLSKWLLEINTGVYVGKLSARVRDKLWDRICFYIKDGQATMVYSADNEQGFKYQTYNTKWQPVDYDGIVLMKQPRKIISSSSENSVIKHGYSKAYKYNVAKNSGHKKSNIYAILSIRNSEIAMIKIIDGNETDNLTVNLQDNNISENDNLKSIKDFIGKCVVYGYNIKNDLSFLRDLFQKNSDEIVITKKIDVKNIARKKIFDINDFDIMTVAEYFSIDISDMQSACDFCRLTQNIILKLNENIDRK